MHESEKTLLLFLCLDVSRSSRSLRINAPISLCASTKEQYDCVVHDVKSGHSCTDAAQ